MVRVASPALIGREEEYVLDCLKTNELTSGKYVKWFEAAFAEFIGVEHAVSCCNGTAALHLALLGLDVQPGDYVLMPALTYIATANAVTYCGGIPVFCDVDPKTWCIDPVDALRVLRLYRKEGRRIKGIIAVDLYGVPADMDQLEDLACEFHCWLVQDSAESHGATLRGQKTGSFGDLGTFSFYGNKIITTGEGGMVTTNDHEIADKIRLYRGQGVDPNRPYWHSVVGYNYRLTNLQAAIGLGQLEMISEHQLMRTNLFNNYKVYLPEFEIQEVTEGAVSANWMFTVLIPDHVNRNEVRAHMLKEFDIETRPTFVPLHLLPPYRSSQRFRNAERIGRNGINLPTYSLLSKSQEIAEALKKSVEVNNVVHR